MAIVGLDHVQLAIPAGEEDRARAFFCSLLGMREVPKPDNLSPSGCWFEGGTARLHIGVDPQFVPARKAHPALMVEDLARLRQQLEAAGYPTHDDKPVAGVERCFVFDPFGNRIELVERV